MAEYIDRDAALREIERREARMVGEKRVSVDAMKSFIKNRPTADVAPVVHGEWIEDHDYLKCPECGVMVKWDFTFFDIGNWNYCPNCGAKMDGGGSDAVD